MPDETPADQPAEIADIPAEQLAPVPVPAQPGPPPPAASNPHAEAAAVLIAALRTQPGIVPELVRGETVAEVQAAYAASQTAYATIKAQIHKEWGDAVPPTPGGPTTPEPATPLDRIKAALR